MLIAVTITIAFYWFNSGVTPHLFYMSDLVSPLFFVNLPTKKNFPSGVTPGGCHPGRSAPLVTPLCVPPVEGFGGGLRRVCRRLLRRSDRNSTFSAAMRPHDTEPVAMVFGHQHRPTVQCLPVEQPHTSLHNVIAAYCYYPAPWSAAV